MFLDRYDPIFKIFKILLDVTCFGARFAKSNNGLPLFDIFKTHLKTFQGFSWLFLDVLVSPKLDNIDSDGSGHVPESWNHRNAEFEALP